MKILITKLVGQTDETNEKSLVLYKKGSFFKRVFFFRCVIKTFTRYNKTIQWTERLN